MHALATDSNEHERSIPVLITLALALGGGLHVLLEQWTIVLPWWLDLTSVVSIYGALHFLLDRYGWRWPMFRRLGLVRVPDLKGRWKGVVDSSYLDPETSERARVEVTLTIQQSWTRILIVLETARSRSISKAAMLVTGEGDPALSYEYGNAPGFKATPTMHAHDGNARLLLRERTLEGSYYTGRDRETHGALRVKRSG